MKNGDVVRYENFFDRLLERVPQFRPVYEEHLTDNEELLHHVLMGDLTRFVIELYRQARLQPGRDTTEKAALKQCLSVLEDAITSPDEKLQELVSVSFLENLHQAEADYEGIRRLLGPALLKEVRHYE